MRSLVELIEQVHMVLDAEGVPHAFGGALSLGQITDPRATADVDVNVFVDPTSIDRVAGWFAPLGYERSSEDQPIAGVRFESEVDPFPIDVFLSLDERYEEIRARCIQGSLRPGGGLLPFLSAVDLSVFKLSFGRPQDWVDLAEIARALPDIDVDVVEDLLVGLRGPTMYPRVARFRAFFERPSG